MRRREKSHDEEDEHETGGGEEEGFMSWEEEVISSVKGKRRVHYYLTHTPSGKSVLAIVGTERSVRHMTYNLTPRFVLHYGALCNVSLSTKWRARRDVCHWLTLLVSRHRRRLEKSACALGPPISDGKCGDLLIPGLPEMPPRKLRSQNSDNEWNGVGWVCSKQLMHYRSFRRNGVDIKVHSFVFIMAAEGNHYIGYLEDMYEDKKTQKRVKVRWFHRAEELLRLDCELNAHPREVFITPQVQVISAECIDGPASVLNPKDYEQCLAVLPSSILDRVHMCFKQLKNSMVSPFSIIKLQGYCNQPVLACINHPLFSKISTKEFDEGGLKDSMIRDVKQSHKRKRLDGKIYDEFSGRNHSRLATNQAELCKAEMSPSALRSQVMKAVPSYPKLKIKLSGRLLKHGNVVGSQPELSASFDKDDEIELLCQDSGIRGCWFRCKVLRVSGRCLKVEYDDLQDAENSGNLQEWVALCRVAASDELGIRYTGRLTIRPRPPGDTKECVLEVGAPVDVWLHDGWWEGIVTRINGTDHVQMYLPGEDRYVTIQKPLLRAAKDWVNCSWVDAKMKPDILSCIVTKANQGISDFALPPISELAEVKNEKKGPTNSSADTPALTSIQEDVTLEEHFHIHDGEIPVESGQEAVEVLGCKADSNLKGDELDVESDFGFTREQYSAYVRVPVS